MAWNNKGNCLHDLGRYKEALQAYEQALYLHPNFPEALDNKRTTQTFLGQEMKMQGDAPNIDIHNSTLTLGKYPVPPGTRCAWPGCDKEANGSIGGEWERIYLCLEHLTAPAAPRS